MKFEGQLFDYWSDLGEKTSLSLWHRVTLRFNQYQYPQDLPYSVLQNTNFPCQKIFLFSKVALQYLQFFQISLREQTNYRVLLRRVFERILGHIVGSVLVMKAKFQGHFKADFKLCERAPGCLRRVQAWSYIWACKVRGVRLLGTLKSIDSTDKKN